MGVIVWRDYEEVFKELKRTQTKANEHETKTNEQLGTNKANKANEQGLFASTPRMLHPPFSFYFLTPPSFFLSIF